MIQACKQTYNSFNIPIFFKLPYKALYLVQVPFIPLYFEKKIWK